MRSRKFGTGCNLVLGFWSLTLVTAMAPSEVCAQARHAVHLEAGVAVPVGHQADRLGLGGAWAAGYEFRLIQQLGLAATYRGTLFRVDDPPVGTYPSAGAHTLAAGLRGHFLSGRIDFWASAAVGAVFTGGAARTGIDFGLGIEFPVLDWLQLGAYGRHHMVFEPSGSNARDAHYLAIGAAATLLFSPNRSTEEPEPEPPAPSDVDGDGVVDGEDACPSEAEDLDGIDDYDGCPDEEPERLPEPESGPEPQSEPEPQPDPEPEPEPEPEPQPEVPPRPPCASGLQWNGSLCEPVALETAQIYFARGRHQPLPGSMVALQDVRNRLAGNARLSVRVVGYASSEGSSTANERLSLARARYVALVLRRGGVETSRMEVVGRGEISPSERHEVPARNRRVDILLVAD